MTLEDAILIAVNAHKGQMDKAGKPYILHPLRVMLNSILETEEEKVAAVLHDVVEDCNISFLQLKEMGCDEKVIQILQFVTKLPEEENDYNAFIQRISKGPAEAIKVKIADLQDNADLKRFPIPSKRDFARNRKYVKAIKFLKAML